MFLFRPAHQSNVNHDLHLKSTHEFLKDFQCYQIQGNSPPSDSKVRYPLSNYTGYDKLSNSFACYVFNISVISEPKTYASAI
jgi:hypothetical protein